MMKFFYVFTFVFSICLGIMGQKIPDHPKKVYVSPENKIYFNKALPVYFYVSTSPDPNAPHYRIQSESTPKYANPMYFDTEGRNTLRSPSAVDTSTKKIVEPKIDVQFQVYADSKPPSTQIRFDKNKDYISKRVNFVSDSLAVSFDTHDELSGVENTYVSLDSGDYKPVTTLVLDKEKKYFLKYYSVDHTGNVESLKEITFSVDKTPPATKLEVVGARYENIIAGSDQLLLTSEDAISGVKHIYVSIDDSVFKPYAGKINTNLLSQGDHKLFYYAVDHVGNAENVQTFAFYVDRTPPQVIEEVTGKTFTANGKEFSAGTSKLKITSFDNKAGVKEIFYSINNTAFIKYDKPILLSGFKGNVLVKSYAVDNVGNQSQSDLSNSRKNSIPYVDLSAPWVGHSFKGPAFSSRDTLFINSSTYILLEAKDTESGIDRIEYQVDSSELKKFSEPFRLQREGLHRVSVYGYDNTENLTRQEFEVVVDTTGPEIFERFSSLSSGTIEENGQKLDQYPAQVVVFLSATDVASGYESILYKLNEGLMLPYMRDIRGFVKGRKNVLKVKATDKLGNETTKTIEFYIR